MEIPFWLIIVVVLTASACGFIVGYLISSRDGYNGQTQELKDFLLDLKVHGRGLVCYRVDPDSVFHVSGRKQ